MKPAILLLGLMWTLTATAEADADRGRKLALTCSACHGDRGLSQNPLWPNLAGQKKEYFIKQLSDFKAGRRQDPIMTPMSQTLKEQDILDLGAYYSQL